MTRKKNWFASSQAQALKRMLESDSWEDKDHPKLGKWKCVDGCGEVSTLSYRCTECGRDMADDN